MDAPRLEPGLLREPAQDEERAGPRQRAALGVEEELGHVSPVQERPAAAEVAAERIGGVTAERDDPFLAALADRAHEPLLEVDASALEPDCLAHSEPGAVEQLDEGPVAQVARSCPRRGLDQALGLPR